MAIASFGPAPRCSHGRQCELRISKMIENPCRSFWGCYLKGSPGMCQFFRWAGATGAGRELHRAREHQSRQLRASASGASDFFAPRGRDGSGAARGSGARGAAVDKQPLGNCSEYGTKLRGRGVGYCPNSACSPKAGSNKKTKASRPHTEQVSATLTTPGHSVVLPTIHSAISLFFLRIFSLLPTIF